MNTHQLQQLVHDSLLLSAAEKKYWLQHLPAMNASQCDRLEKILREPMDALLPFQKVIESFFQNLVHTKA